MLIFILHTFHHRLQFISGNPWFCCGRPAKCSFEVYMDPIIDCSSSLETHHSAADVFQNAYIVSTWIPAYGVSSHVDYSPSCRYRLSSHIGEPWSWKCCISIFPNNQIFFVSKLIRRVIELKSLYLGRVSLYLGSLNLCAGGCHGALVQIIVI